MADLNGAWVPQTEEEREFIFAVNALASDAFNQGVSQDDIVGGLTFLAATVAMQDPDEDSLPDVPEPSDKREVCVHEGCDTEIEEVEAFIGGMAIIRPCGHKCQVDEVPGWVDTPGGNDD
jgi:hypothetical protein